MNKLLLLILLPLFATAQGEKPFHISGSIRTARPVEKIYISYQHLAAQITDSFPVIKGNYSYNGKLKEPVIATLEVRYGPTEKSPYPALEKIEFLLEPVKYRLVTRDSLHKTYISGSKGHEGFRTLKAAKREFEENTAPMNIEYGQARAIGDTTTMRRLEAEYNREYLLYRERLTEFIRNNPRSPASFFALRQLAGSSMDPVFIEPLFNLLPREYHEWPSVMHFKRELDLSKMTAVGALAMDFVQMDTAGVPVSLSSFRGRYVLLDFWASWCGPCRRENPNLVNAHSRYRDRNFTVLGVSLDRPDGRENWLKAIRDDSLDWTQVSDLKYWDNEAARLYGIRGIPQNLLIDPQGRIVAKNLRGEALHRKLAELLGD